MDRNRIKLGVEIEAILNKDYTQSFRIGQYHNGIKKGKNWEIQNDGSLYDNLNFPRHRTAEFVSKTFSSKKSFFNGLKEFESFFNGEHLSKVLAFNLSCGCHIHIGLNHKKQYSDKIRFEQLVSLRELFFKKIKDSEILSENTKENILNHYFRNYAKKIKKQDWYNRTEPRGSEFNIYSERDNKGLEWRSINLRGVKSWVEFYEVFNIVYFCCEKLFKMRTTNSKTKNKAIRLNREHLKNILKNNSNFVTIEIKAKEKENIILNKIKNEVLRCVI